MIPNPVSLPKTYYRSLLSSQQDTTGSDQPRIENDEEKLKTRKIRIYPTPEEREKLRKWMGTVRWTYNKVLEMVQDNRITDMSIIRKHYLNDECFATEEFKWVKETPREVRSYAIRQLMSAYKTNKKLHENNFRMKFRSKKDRTQTISILARDWNRNRGQYAFLKSIITSERPSEINNTINITMNHLGHFYLCVSIPLDIIDNQDDVHGKVISLDPGVRTFMTGYDPNGQIIKWGNGDIDKVFKLSKKYDKLQSDKDLALGRVNKRKRFRLKKKMLRTIQRIRNLIDECHHQLARWLCQNYEIILLPKFEASQMVLKNKRKIRSKTARAMLTWSHFRFRMFLLHKIREYKYCKVIEYTEEYTSKTCGHCGQINDKLGGSKTFRCDSCKVEMDRDANGARNILLKLLTEGQVLA